MRDRVIAYSNGRVLRAKDLIRDNPQTLRREYLGLDFEVHSWVSAAEICRKGSDHPRWGTYSPDIDKNRILCAAT